MSKKLLIECNEKYKESLMYRDLNYDGKEALDTVMAVLERAHFMKQEKNISPREFLLEYSPDNTTLKDAKEISWPQALHALITDMMLGNDVISQAYIAGRKH